MDSWGDVDNAGVGHEVPGVVPPTPAQWTLSSVGPCEVPRHGPGPPGNLSLAGVTEVAQCQRVYGVKYVQRGPEGTLTRFHEQL